ncbi:hypothetical protein [Bifidobacterium mongoliense]|uniref:hypothetical protein n=1 Tax=Bifidobacterium mongoliense TaxID=518643 RepID=UPI00264A0D64|nr:hypothetical protein [Bifidobacterium mongoliense]MDN5980267.1 excisionase family protein [Bifidobacterium mongoliense]
MNMATITTTPVPQWVSAAQIPTVFGLSEKTITRAIADGAPIQRRKVGTKNLYNVETINTWLNDLDEE